MSFTTAITRVSANGDGVSVSFTVPWLFYANTDLLVILGGVTQALGVQFNVTGAGLGSGTVSFVTAPPIGVGNVQIILNDPLTQVANFVDGTAFPAATLNQVNDRAVQISARLYDLISRSLRVPDGDTSPVMLLPPAAQRAGLVQGYDSNGNSSLLLVLPPGTAISSAIIGSFISPPTAAEAAALLTVVNGWYQPNNVLRYGIVPNNPAAASANTAIAKALWNPTITSGPHGTFTFPNTTGADIYYFNGVIPMRYDCYLEGQGCTVNYTATVGAGDANTGLFLFLSDGGIQNMKFTVACDTTAATGAGHAIFLGGRDVGTYFTVFDSLLPRSLGRLVLRNLVINVNNTGSHVSSSGGIEMLGGLRDVLIENVAINLSLSCPYGIIYEFGWATNEVATANRQTSHAHNMIFRNIDVSNVGNQDGGTGAGLALGGAYNCLIDGLYVNTAPSAFIFYPGEALFYRPWVGVDDIGAKHNITLRNIVGDSLSGTGVSLGGASSASGGYLAATIAALGHPADYIAQTDLMTFSWDGGAIQAAGVGINVTGSCDIRNVISNGAAASGQLVVDDELINGTFTNCKFLNGSGTGVRMSLSGPIWSPARLKQLIFDNCVVAGNTTNGYILSNSRSVHIRGGRIGYSVAYDGVAETAQINCVNVAGASAGAGAMIDSVYCTPGTAGTVYVGSGTTSANDVKNPKGTISFSGTWNINGLVNCSSTVLADKTSIVNTADKYAGKLAYDTSNKRMLVAQGSADVSQWELCDGTVAVTPA